MFLKAASHPAALREITEDLILSGWDATLLVAAAPQGHGAAGRRLSDCWGTILSGPAADHCSSNSHPRLPNAAHALQAPWAPTPKEFTQFVSALLKLRRIRKS